MTKKQPSKHSLPEIKVNVKTPPSSGGVMDWGPIFKWLKQSLRQLFKK